jgi:hypothetical protein
MASFLITRMTYEAQLLPLLLRAVIDPTATLPPLMASPDAATQARPASWLAFERLPAVLTPDKRRTFLTTGSGRDACIPPD